MLVKLISDLHLGYTDPFRYVDHGEQVCVLAGDIAEGVRGVHWAEDNIPGHIQVIYVPGNHEYYNHDYVELNRIFKMYKDGNVRVLMEDSIVVGDIEFWGTTLWTNFHLYPNVDLNRKNWHNGLNDARYIKVNGGELHSKHFIQWNQKALDFLTCAKPTKNTNVLVTHYCPDLSVAPQYRGDKCTPGFATRIPQEIHEKFDFHFHGHTHSSMDYEYPYGTKVKCNPRGYGFENFREFNNELVVDI